MCYGIDPGLAETWMVTRMREAHREVELWHLLRQLRAERAGWLSQQSCRLLRQVGHRLVMLGKRMERSGLPQPLF